MWKVKRAGYFEARVFKTVEGVIEEVEDLLEQDILCDIVIRKVGRPIEPEQTKRMPKEAGKPRETNPPAKGIA